MLFPEGGGQPYDTGFIDDIQVYNVQRKKLEHIHYTKQPVPVGQQVLVKLDWERRFVNKNYFCYYFLVRHENKIEDKN